MTFKDLIDEWPRIKDFAEDIGVSYATAKAMRSDFRTIPAQYWRKMIRGARKRGLNVTYDDLAALTEKAFERFGQKNSAE